MLLFDTESQGKRCSGLNNSELVSLIAAIRIHKSSIVVHQEKWFMWLERYKTNNTGPNARHTTTNTYMKTLTATLTAVSQTPGGNGKDKDISPIPARVDVKTSSLAQSSMFLMKLMLHMTKMMIVLLNIWIDYQVYFMV